MTGNVNKWLIRDAINMQVLHGVVDGECMLKACLINFFGKHVILALRTQAMTCSRD